MLCESPLTGLARVSPVAESGGKGVAGTGHTLPPYGGLASREELDAAEQPSAG